MRTIVSGACGRTGSLVTMAIVASPELDLVGAVEAPGTACVGARLCDVLPGCDATLRVRGSLDDLDDTDYDVIVDFSAPDQTVRCGKKASTLGAGLVTGTTGLTEEQTEVIRQSASRSAVVLASNMSVGANVLFALVRQAVASLGQRFDVEVIETHHRWKKDAPSGTALTISEIVAAERSSAVGDVIRTGRAGRSPRRMGEIGIHSIRGGSVAGRHTVQFLSDTETVTLEHTVLSREAFAEGAVRAAVFSGSNPPGLYDMLDVLGLTAARASIAKPAGHAMDDPDHDGSRGSERGRGQ